MAEVVLSHHVQGVADGLPAIDEQLRQGGHVVHTPDLPAEVVYAGFSWGVMAAQRLAQTRPLTAVVRRGRLGVAGPAFAEFLDRLR